jgi:hypothetical protein
MIQQESPRLKLRRLIAQLKTARSSWDTQYSELAELIQPWRWRGASVSSGHNSGEKKLSKMLDETAGLALRTMQSGMLASDTSPANIWFRLATPDRDLMEFGPVKIWLDTVEKRLRDILLRSNFYNEIAVFYGDLGLFGTAVMTCLEDPETVVRFNTHPCGSYYLATNDKRQIDTMARCFMLTARQMLQWFKEENCSDAVKQAAKTAGEQTFEVTHVVRPNEEWDERKLDSKYKKFASCYFESSSQEDKYLLEEGFDENPVVAGRWQLDGEDVYGKSPAMYILPTIKELNALIKSKSKGVQKGIDPPMVVSPELMERTPNILPGGITVADERDGHPRFRAAHEVQFDLGQVREDIMEKQRIIRRGLFEDLFLMFAQSDQREYTATEIAERKQEKLLVLGPVVTRGDNEVKDPIINRVFNIALRNGLLPEPPRELQGQDLKIEYVSILAQAQKQVSLAGIDRLVGAAMNMAKVQPDSLDKLDFDQTVDELAEVLGTPPKIVRTDEQVAAIRAQRAKQQQAMQRAEMGATMAKSAKDLASADTSGKNALTDALAAVKAGAPLPGQG